MKNLLQGLVLFSIIATTACTDAPKADEATATAPQEVQEVSAEGTQYTVDLQKSHIDWIGTKPTGRHHGSFKLQDASLTAANNILTGGNFTIDVNSITALDDDGSANAKLLTHLKSADFFDVDKYKTAKFEITNVQEGVNSGDKKVVLSGATHTITGNLTMKDITKSITFPAIITFTETGLTAHAEFNIDRTQWGIVYRSDKSMGDKFINTDVNLTVHLEAVK
jgi:polyisoprenoid-binding protein YceI